MSGDGESPAAVPLFDSDAPPSVCGGQSTPERSTRSWMSGDLDSTAARRPATVPHVHSALRSTGTSLNTDARPKQGEPPATIRRDIARAIEATAPVRTQRLLGRALVSRTGVTRLALGESPIEALAKDARLCLRRRPARLPTGDGHGAVHRGCEPTSERQRARREGSSISRWRPSSLARRQVHRLALLPYRGRRLACAAAPRPPRSMRHHGRRPREEVTLRRTDPAPCGHRIP